MQENQEPSVVENNYIETIKKLKENSVSKNDYDKVVEENKNLLDSIVNGGTSPATEEVVQKRSVEEIRKELFNDEEKTNLHYAELALELRDRIIEDGGVDPFLPVGKDVVITNNDKERAEKVAEVFKDCIEYAEGDSDIFTNELQRRTRDVSIPQRRK